jgi:hypothetical protein
MNTVIRNRTVTMALAGLVIAGLANTASAVDPRVGVGAPATPAHAASMSSIRA